MFIYVNGMKIRQPNDVFKGILSQLTNGKSTKLENSKASYILNDYFEKGKGLANVDPSIVK